MDIETLIPETVPTSKREYIGAVLKKIVSDHGGIVTPEQLVSIARPENHPLHPYFTWDDTEAARLHRINEARAILRVAVEYLQVNNKREPVRVTVHLSSDDTGYRLLSEVLSDAEMRAQLIADAGRDIETFKRRYQTIIEIQRPVRKLEKTISKLKRGKK